MTNKIKVYVWLFPSPPLLKPAHFPLLTPLLSSSLLAHFSAALWKVIFLFPLLFAATLKCDNITTTLRKNLLPSLPSRTTGQSRNPLETELFTLSNELHSLALRRFLNLWIFTQHSWSAVDMLSLIAHRWADEGVVALQKKAWKDEWECTLDGYDESQWILLRVINFFSFYSLSSFFSSSLCCHFKLLPLLFIAIQSWIVKEVQLSPGSTLAALTDQKCKSFFSSLIQCDDKRILWSTSILYVINSYFIWLNLTKKEIFFSFPHCSSLCRPSFVILRGRVVWGLMENLKFMMSKWLCHLLRNKFV